MPAKRQKGQFVSNIFTKYKPDGTLRIIIDLTQLNREVVYQHFKMENLNTVINLLSQGMASIDWKDAFTLYQSHQIIESSCVFSGMASYISTLFA